jgi:hypothetical protein
MSTNISPVADALSSQQLHVLQHSLGVDEYGDGNQYRNRFVTDPGCPDGKLCCELVEMKMMKDHGPQTLAGGMHCYTVTPLGIDAMVLQSPVRPKLTRSKQRYRDYLSADSSLTFAEWIAVSK